VAASPTTAPTSTPSATDTPAAVSGGACLIGTWEFSDMSDYMTSIMSKTGGTVKFVGQEGKVLYIFGADGKSKVDAQNSTLKLSSTVQGMALNIDVTMNGSATADYTATNDGKVTFSNPKTDGLTLSAKMNDQELFSGTSNDLAAMFGVSADAKYDTFTYECDATTLRYTPPVEGAAPVVLKRVSP
jgi:hypothetical protein